MKYQYIDLSRTLTPGIGELKNHPPTELVEFQTHASHGRSNAQLSYSIHCGTHVDCPYHFVPDGMRVDEMDLDRFHGRGILVDLENKLTPGEAISLNMLMTEPQIRNIGGLSDAIVLINTGWGANYGSQSYYTGHPYLGADSARFLAENKVKAVGLDFPPDAKAGETVHTILLSAGVLIIENLTNMANLRGKDFNVLAFPVKLFRQSGGPARVVAQVERIVP